MTQLVAIWETHRDADWPLFSSPLEGQLMTLDTVISGCVVHYLGETESLDPQRVEILKDCITDLDGLLPDVPQESRAYFERLRELGGLLLETASGR